MMKNNHKALFSRRELLRVLGLAGIGLTVAGSLSNTASAQKKTDSAKDDLQGAGFYRFKLGALDCAVVSDGFFKLKPSEFFINKPAEIKASLEAAFLPTDEINLGINTLIVRNGNNIALFDTGVGNYNGESGGRLLKNLERADVKPEEITDVFFSHAHFDHIGGNFNSQNALNFPKATFHLSEKEWTTATGEKEFFGDLKVDETLKKTLLDAIRKNLVPLKDRIKLFKTDTEILPGIKAVTAYGHTPGHSTYLIESNGDSLLYVGDLIHHIIQLSNPQIQMNGNSYLQQSADSRRKILENVATHKTKMMTAHFPFPGIGHVRRKDNKQQSFEWVPIQWQWE